MAIRQEPLDFDPLSAPVPGQSLTDKPGLRPWEKPALSSDPKQVIETLEEALKEESTEQRIADMLDVGVSAETIAEAILQKCFTEGICTPDVSEIVKPSLFMAIVQIGTDHNIVDMVLFNDEVDNEEEGRMSNQQKALLMEKIFPEKYSKITENSLEEEEMDIPEDMMLKMAAGDEGQVQEDTGSFIDMEIPEEEEPYSEEIIEGEE